MSEFQNLTYNGLLKAVTDDYLEGLDEDAGQADGGIPSDSYSSDSFFSSSRINGKEILKTDPWPRTLSTVILPW